MPRTRPIASLSSTPRSTRRLRACSSTTRFSLQFDYTVERTGETTEFVFDQRFNKEG